MFDRKSRYYDVENTILVRRDGERIAYKKRRFLPKIDRDVEHPLVEAVDQDRLDLLAARILGDPEQFWRICDVNGVMNPFELLDEPGKWIKVPLPGG